jgi:hypothetical protein
MNTFFRRFQQVLPYILTIVLFAFVVMAIMTATNNRNDVILKDHTVEFCARWVDVDIDDCGEWADEMIDQHGETLHECFQDYAPRTLDAYECVLDGVFE